MSKQWWYSIQGERKGPLSSEELRIIIEHGTLSARHLVWKQGLEGWLPIAELDELSDALSAIPPELPEPTPREKNIELPLAGPWRRFFGRLIDLWALALPTAFLVSVAASAASMEFALWIQEPGSEYAFGWLILPLVLFTEAIIYAIFGTTLGKALLGIKVVTVSADPVTFSQYAKRLVGVYWSGLGTGFPLVSLFTMAYQCGRLRKGRHAGYDEGRFNIKATKIGFFRIVLAVLVIAGLFSVNGALQVVSRDAKSGYYSGFNWTNDVTGRTVSIPAGWIHQRQQNDENQPIDIFSGPRVGAFAVFAKEDIDPNLSLIEYAQFWAIATEGTMSLSIPGHQIQMHGRPALHITGTMAGDRSQKIDAVLVRKGRHIWRVVLLGTSRRNPASEEAKELRDVLFSSIE